MELLQLRYFCRAARLENFSKAAETLNIPQSAISRTIANLERELGCTLFDRSGRRVTLNSRGELFLRAAEAALAGLDSAVEQLSQSTSRSIKVLVLAATKLIPDLFADYLSNRQGVSFVLRQQPGDKDYDFRITSMPCAPEHSCSALATERIVIAVPEHHRLYSRDLITPEDIKDERMVGFSRTKDIRTLIDSYCIEHGFSPNIAFEAENAATFRGMVERHMGIAFVPERVFSSSPTDGLRLIPLSDPLERTIIIEWDKRRMPEKHAFDFRDFAVDWFSKRI